MPKVSLIVPVYNSGRTLKTCLDSIACQTMEGLEVIVVDDHSTDDSMAVLQEYVSAYQGPKKFVVTQTVIGKGPGAARNTGIDMANGEYIGFVDSDDHIDKDFCHDLYEAAVAADADIAMCNISFDYSSGKSVVKYNPRIVPGIFTGAKKKSYLRRYVSYFWSYIYRKDMIESFHIRFPDTRSAEDSCFLACCLLAAGRIAQIDAPSYHYVISDGSISHKKDPGRWRQKLESFRRLREFARQHDLYKSYLWTLEFLVFKKSFLGAVKDLVTNNL